MRLSLLQRRIYLTACVIREEREGEILFVWLEMTACVIKGGERAACRPNRRKRTRGRVRRDALLAHICSMFASGRTLRTFYV
jgi:hypothetical protein